MPSVTLSKRVHARRLFFSFILITLNYDAGTWNLIVPFRKKMGFYNETGTLVSKLDLQDFKGETLKDTNSMKQIERDVN